MKKRILHVINSMLPGGAEILLANSLSAGGLCEHAENHLAYFMAPSYLLEKLDKEVQVHFLDYKGTTDIIRLIKQLRRIILENKIDIVHSHLNPASLYTHIACPVFVPHVHTIHTTYSMDEETTKFKLVTEKYFYLRKRGVNIIVLSDFAQQDFLSQVPFRGKSFVLNNFVPDEFFRGKAINNELGKLRLVSIGSLRPVKNFEYLLEIFKYLKEYDISLDIYGGGTQEFYKTVIKDHGLKVRMMGHSKNIPDIIQDYDLFIMPSKFEGFPLSLFEAMAAEVPLMLSDIKPLKSIVKEHAIYFKLDNAEEVARQLSYVMQNKNYLTDMAGKAKIYAEKNVRRSAYIKRLLLIYDKVMDKSKLHA